MRVCVPFIEGGGGGGSVNLRAAPDKNVTLHILLIELHSHQQQPARTT